MDDGAAPQPTASYREDAAAAGDDVIEAVGRASEALEYVERARGHLYSFHQLMGRADLLFGEAADLLAEAGEQDCARSIDDEVVGRNVLDGRWTFQIVDEFDDLYHRPVASAVAELERSFQGGRRHVYEARLKERRRSPHMAGHEHRPPASHDARVETDPPGGPPHG
jgi:hypothetical protein